MNTQQMSDLGLKMGDEIFIKSNHDISGFYRIGDTGCAYGTIDIYVAPGKTPHWGAENGAQLVILNGVPQRA